LIHKYNIEEEHWNNAAICAASGQSHKGNVMKWEKNKDFLKTSDNGHEQI